jgi:hypothetical protein
MGVLSQSPGGSAGIASAGTVSAGTASAGTASAGTASAGTASAGTASAGTAFTGTAEALAAARASLAYLAGVDAASLPVGELADCLRGLEAVGSVHTAARTTVLAAFIAHSGCQDDGHGSARSWLTWRTGVTERAASGIVAWVRRVEAHPLVHAALTTGAISESIGRELCRQSGRLPEDARQDADQILLTAHAGGATLADLIGLVEEMLRRCAPPDKDKDDRGFTDRGVQLDLHFRGAGKLTGDLTPECAAAVMAGLDALSKKAGPADDRTPAQRRHDALEEVFRRVIAGGDLPDTAGQPTQILLHMTLDQVRALNGAAAEAAWAAGRAAGDSEPGWLSSRKAAEGYSCDAQIQPIVSGHVDPAALAALTGSWLAGHGRPACTCGRCTCGTGPGSTGSGSTGSGLGYGGLGSAGTGEPLSPQTMRRLQDTLLRYAADVLSGPAGLASYLRTRLPAAQFPPSASLPLDVGKVTHTIPGYLRRAVIARDRRCAVPGCRARPSRCHVHHIKPRSQGGTTSLGNLVLLCEFHHLTAIHRWGWTIALNGDGTTTFASPDGKRVFHSHGPPATVQAADSLGVD